MQIAHARSGLRCAHFFVQAFELRIDAFAVWRVPLGNVAGYYASRAAFLAIKSASALLSHFYYVDFVFYRQSRRDIVQGQLLVFFGASVGGVPNLAVRWP